MLVPSTVAPVRRDIQMTEFMVQVTNIRICTLKAPGVGVTIGLPVLDAMTPALVRAATKPPVRLMFFYLPNGIVRRCFFPGEGHLDAPDFIGGFDADKVLMMIEEHRVSHMYLPPTALYGVLDSPELRAQLQTLFKDGSPTTERPPMATA